MTGGKPRREWAELRALSPHDVRRPLPPLPFENDVAEVVDWWARAAKLRARIDRVLRAHNLTFSQWRMLHATEIMVRETGDMVSQLEIRRRVHMDATTASRLMFKLGEQGWLDWQPDYYGFAYRIFATEKAKEMLAETRPRVVELAKAVQRGAR